MTVATLACDGIRFPHCMGYALPNEVGMSDEPSLRDAATVLGERIGMLILAALIVFLIWSSRTAFLQMMTAR